MGNGRSWTGTGSRRRRRGQSLVEFALVAPVFLGLMFGIAEAGMLLYAFNSAQHASTLGAEVIAANGSATTTDTDAIAAMGRTDFGTSGLVTIRNYDIWMLAPDGSNSRDPTACLTGSTPSPCHQKYAANGTLISGNWPPTARHTSAATADFVELDITYSYHYFLTPGTVIQFTAQRYFRLEPLT